MSSKSWKEFTKSFSKVDYKYKHNLNEEHKSLFEVYEKINNEESIEIEKLGGYLERALAYDAVWVMAYSLDKTLKQ